MSDDKKLQETKDGEQLADFDAADEEDDRDAGGNEEQTSTAFVGVHISGFRDFLLKPELNRAIQDAGFEHPSEVQHQCIPQAILQQDLICQAKSGMGKTAVFVLAVLQQLEETDEKAVQTLVTCHTRELAYQIANEFKRFSKYMPYAKCAVVYGGIPITTDKETLNPQKDDFPNIVVGTPGRLKALVDSGVLKLNKLKIFVMDECDKLLENMDMRADVQSVYISSPKGKQVMLFSATLPKAVRDVAKKFMQNPVEIFVDSEAKLTLHGLQQYFVRVPESGKNRKLTSLLDNLEFNQVCIFVKSVQRCKALAELLRGCNFPAVCIHGSMPQEERIQVYSEFKAFKSRIMVATDLFGRGIDIERVNIVINYDMTEEDPDAYLHRVGRAGRFGTKGLAITFLSNETETKTLEAVQKRFEVSIPELPAKVEPSTYMNA